MGDCLVKHSVSNILISLLQIVYRKRTKKKNESDLAFVFLILFLKETHFL